MSLETSRSRVAAASFLILAAAGMSFDRPAFAQQEVKIPQHIISYANKPRVSLPMNICWYKGKKNLYIITDTSDKGLAGQMGVNYVPGLANAVNAPQPVLDDIYAVTNSTSKDQYNIVPSQPTPVGPNNADPAYSPLWQLTLVTWKDGVTQKTLKSEEEVKGAASKGLVTLNKTLIVINCPILYTDAGGLLPNAVIHFNDNDGDNDKYQNGKPSDPE